MENTRTYSLNRGNKQDIICTQEHGFIHYDILIKEHAIGQWKLLTCSA